MNLKQKLTYMLIGSLFTLAGYFLATLAKNQPPNAHAQDNTPKVFGKIVCKELEVVNKEGKTIALIKENDPYQLGGGGDLSLYNKDGKHIARINEVLSGGRMVLYNFLGKEKEAVSLSAHSGGRLIFRRPNGKKAVDLHHNKLGSWLQLFTEDGSIATLGSNWLQLSVQDTGIVSLGVNALDSRLNNGLSIYSKDIKKLVYIGSITDLPNEGLIGIRDHKGEWRLITAD